MSHEGQRTLDQAYDVLEQEAPDRVARFIRWLRSPKSKWVRLPLGILFIAAGFLGPVLPVVGLEFVPVGLLLVAQDVPFLKKPVGRAMLWLEHKWIAHRQKKKRGSQGQGQGQGQASTSSPKPSVPDAVRPTM